MYKLNEARYGTIFLYSINEILTELNNCIIQKKPFSCIRFGDGGIKFIHSIIFNDESQLKSICEREGIPFNKCFEIFELWGKYARQANFIDYPAIYYTDLFWGKFKKNLKEISQKTVDRMLAWDDLYSRAEFDNKRFCNPEINYLVCLRIEDRINLLDILQYKKVCCISTYENMNLPFETKFITIVGHNQNQYVKSFEFVIDFIKKNAKKFDLFLVSAGELGRIYSGYIKICGGRAFDFGFMIDYWCNYKVIPERLEYFIKPNPKNNLELIVTQNGDPYLKYL